MKKRLNGAGKKNRGTAYPLEMDMHLAREQKIN
jgi:hypothetical protein